MNALNQNHYRTNLLLLGLNLSVPKSKRSSKRKNQKNTCSISGVIRLFGKETPNLGTSLKIGNLAVGSCAIGKTILLTDVHTKINEYGPKPKDCQNYFLITGLDLRTTSANSSFSSLSVNITMEGVAYRYTTPPPISNNKLQQTTSYLIDLKKKKIQFLETKVVNTKTNSVLTMDGTVTWT